MLTYDTEMFASQRFRQNACELRDNLLDVVPICEKNAPDRNRRDVVRMHKLCDAVTQDVLTMLEEQAKEAKSARVSIKDDLFFIS